MTGVMGGSPQHRLVGHRCCDEPGRQRCCDSRRRPGQSSRPRRKMAAPPLLLLLLKLVDGRWGSLTTAGYKCERPVSLSLYLFGSSPLCETLAATAYFCQVRRVSVRRMVRENSPSGAISPIAHSMRMSSMRVHSCGSVGVMAGVISRVISASKAVNRSERLMTLMVNSPSEL